MNILKNITAALVLTVASISANATLFNLTINATVTDNAGLDGLVDLGDLLEFTIFLDDTNPDTDGSDGVYEAANDSPINGFFLLDVWGTGHVIAVGGGVWAAEGLLDASAEVPGLFLPYSVVLSGVDMTANQILPDFNQLIHGTFTLDMGGIFPGERVVGMVTSISLEPASAVPVPAAAWLFGSALISLVGIKRRK